METPHLQPTIGLRSIVLFGLAYMGPLIGIGIFGVIATQSQGASAAAMVLATIAILFTALSYGTMARLHPASGSAYTYARKSIGPRTGFLVGWAILLDYLFIPLVIWLVGVAYLEAEFPAVPKAVWVIALVALTTVINVLGIKVADRANFLFVMFEVLVLLFFIVLSIGHIWGNDGPQALFTLEPFTGVANSLGPIATGAAVAAYLFLGFDAVTTLSEETKDAKRNIPLGLILVAVIGGVVFIVTLYLLSILAPGGDLADSVASDIAKTIGGNVFGAIFLAALVCQQFTAGIAAQASSARLMYAMGRDESASPQVLRQALRSLPDARERHPGVRRGRPRCDLADARGVDIVHQLRRVPRVHDGECVRDRLLHPEPTREEAQPARLRRLARTRGDHRHRVAVRAGQHRPADGLHLAGTRRALSGRADPRIPQATARAVRSGHERRKHVVGEPDDVVVVAVVRQAACPANRSRR